MDEPMIRVPVKCPLCGGESLAHFQVAMIAEAFILKNPIRLRAKCHDHTWEASEVERQQIREYLAERRYTSRDQKFGPVGPSRSRESFG